jgi:hypothetical protein
LASGLTSSLALSWHFALDRTPGDKLLHPAVLACFRHHLIEHQQCRLALPQVLDDGRLKLRIRSSGPCNPL